MLTNPPANSNRGLTMVGNPFNFSIDWKNSQVLLRDNFGALIKTSLLEANGYNILDHYAYVWDVDQQVYIPYNSLIGGKIGVWDGFWVEQLSNVLAQLVVYRVSRVPGSQGLYSARCYDARVMGEKDYLGTDFEKETDRFNLTVRNEGNTVIIKTTVKGNEETTNFPLNIGHSVIDANGIETKLVNIVYGNNNRTYQFQVSSVDIKYKQGMTQISFDFQQGDIISPIVPNQGYNLITVIRTPLEINKANYEVVLLIPPQQYLPKPNLANSYQIKLSSNRDWFVPISIQDRSGNYKDLYNAFGIMSNASDNYDVNDAKNFTPMKANNDFVDIYFPHNDTTDIENYWWERPDIFCYDIRSDSAIKSWKMMVAAYNLPNGEMTISWNTSQISKDWTLTLYDLTNDKKIDMLTSSSYTFVTPNQQYSKLPFNIIAEFQPLVEIKTPSIPKDWQIFNVYPNPFNSVTNITYSLNIPCTVEISFYNCLREKIKVINLHHESKGTYNIKWYGDDEFGNSVPTGIYFCQLKTPEFIKTLKLVLLK